MNRIVIITVAITIAFCLETNAREKANGQEIAVAQAAAKQLTFTDTELGKIDTFFLMHTRSAAKNQANMTAVDTDGKTLLHLAAQGGINEAVKYLVSKGADVHAKDKNGDTPLHYAALKGLPENVKYLVSVGADVSVKNQNGDMPIHYAAHRHGATYGGAGEIFEYLISVGADVNAKGGDGLTPNQQIVEALEKKRERELAREQRIRERAQEQQRIAEQRRIAQIAQKEWEERNPEWEQSPEGIAVKKEEWRRNREVAIERAKRAAEAASYGSESERRTAIVLAGSSASIKANKEWWQSPAGRAEAADLRQSYQQAFDNLTQSQQQRARLLLVDVRSWNTREENRARMERASGRVGIPNIVNEDWITLTKLLLSSTLLPFHVISPCGQPYIGLPEFLDDWNP